MNPLLSLKLQKKSVLILAVILFLAIGLNTAVLTYVASDKFRQTTFASGYTLCDNVKKEIMKGLELGLTLDYMDSIEDKLRTIISENQNFGYGMVVDAAGKVLFHTDQSKRGAQYEAKVKELSSKKHHMRSSAKAYELMSVLTDSKGAAAGLIVLGLKKEVVSGSTYSLLVWALGVSAVSLILFVGVVYFAVSKFITRPILEMQGVASVISSGDLTKSIEVAGRDEIAELGGAINNMAGNLKEIISKIRNITASVSSVVSGITDSSGKVLEVADTQQKAVTETARAIEEMNNSVISINRSAEILLGSSEDASSALAEMTVSISQVADSSDVFNHMAQDSAGSIEEMIISIREIAQSLESLSASADETASALLQVNATIRQIEQSAEESVKLAENVALDASEKGMGAATAAINGMKEIKSSVGALSEVINRLGQNSEDIGNIVNVIDEIADQTSLLALNAAILAAQAGQHGAGFAVVADEIKGLAERTSLSTKEISELIRKVQAETRSSVEMASEGIESVEKGMGLVTQVSAALNSIYSSAQVSTEMSKSIQRATTEEASVIKQITDSIRNMTEQIKLISKATQEQSKGSQLILEATEKVKDGAIHTKKATEEQLEGSRQIASMSDKVKDQSGSIAKAIGAQKDRSDQIVGSLESIQKTTKDLLSASARMQQAVEALKEDSTKLLAEIQKFIV